MSKVGSMTNAVNKVLSTFKGGYGNSAMKGAAIGGGVGAAYGGISDNHTALGMGIAGAGLGFGAGREFAGLKAWQGQINERMAKSGLSGPNSKLQKASGMNGSFDYAKNRFNNLGV